MIIETIAANEQCRHKYTVDSKSKGVCCYCGIEVQYSWDGRGEPVLLKSGYLPDTSNSEINKESERMTGGNKALQRHAEIESHAEEIITDFNTLGNEPTRKKWNISECGWSNFKKRHLLGKYAETEKHPDRPLQDPPPRKPEYTIPDKLKSELHQVGLQPVIYFVKPLPTFPDFSNDWTPEVQLRWIDVYLDLVKLEINVCAT